MKKVLSFVAIAAITMFVTSCGNDEAAKKLADSLRQDSINMATKHVTDSTWGAHVKDSTDKANADAQRMQHWKDSMRDDSIANAGKKGTSKPKPKPDVKPKAGTGKG
jgi:sugar/nucleoside kinase (ribokinase family)